MALSFLLASVFLACLVEAVEALTIVLAAGVTRGWAAAARGVLAAVVALAVLVAVLGPLLTLVPLRALRLVVGALLLLYGLQWLRKAVLRAGGAKAKHDEAALFARYRDEAAAGGGPAGHRWLGDPTGFVLAFKGVLLEGLEVVVIVLTFGANAGRTGAAALAALAAVVVVAGVGAAVRAPLARVPENALKTVVGVMLTTFGMFWAGEGAGVDWPGGELALLPLLALTAGVVAALTGWVSRTVRRAAAPSTAAGSAAARPAAAGRRGA